ATSKSRSPRKSSSSMSSGRSSRGGTRRTRAARSCIRSAAKSAGSSRGTPSSIDLRAWGASGPPARVAPSNRSSRLMRSHCASRSPCGISCPANTCGCRRMSFSFSFRAIAPMSYVPSSRPSCACSAICSSRSPSSSRCRDTSPASSAASASYASSSRCGRSDAWVCSRSQGQPFGARSRSAIRVTVASETGRIVANVCRSSALAGTTSTPEGHRARTAASVAAPLLELETGDEAEDVVRLLLLVQPVLVRVVLDLRLLIVVERARVRLLDDLVPGRVVEAVVLLADLPRVEGEDLVLGREVGQHAARDPAEVAALVLRGRILGVLLGDVAEVGPALQRGRDVVHLLELGAERLEVAADRLRSRDLDHRDVHLRRRGGDRRVLALGRELVAQHVVAGVPLDVGEGEARRQPLLHDLVRLGTLPLLHLDDVVAEVGLDGIADRADWQGLYRVLELLDELAFSDPTELAARVLRPGIVGIVLCQLVPESLVVRVLPQ